jgi:Pentapeptide repeats (8 copies)
VVNEVWQRLKRILAVKWRSPAGLTAIGVAATLVLALAVVIALLSTGGAKAVSDNAALLGALIALGGVFTAQIVNSTLEDRRAHETAVQNYFERVGKLLIEQPLRRASPGDNLSTVVRAQTLSLLEGLDPDRKRIVMAFLYESALISRRKPVISLSGANLRMADLRGADLGWADLSLAFLFYADLRGAFLPGAYMFSAALSGADLSGAYLAETYLSRAILSDVDLSGADLSRARGWTEEQLKATLSLEGATMPDGQTLRSDETPNGPTFEDWLKDRERRKEDDENE